jgi:flagellar motor switch protein FliN/FliY
MSSSDLNLPDLAQGGAPVVQPRAAATAEHHQEDARDRIAADLKPVFDVPVSVQAVIGRTTMEVSSLLELGPGSVLELDRRVGEAIDIYVNSRLVARGEVVVVDDRLGVTMTEIIKNSDA